MSNSEDNASWFASRPVRTETCSRCNGHGTIGKGYALAPREGVGTASMIMATVVGSADIFTACAEASEIAKRANRSVHFDFNGRTVIVRPKDNPVTIARSWWQKAYGETPEQSQARR